MTPTLGQGTDHLGAPDGGAGISGADVLCDLFGRIRSTVHDVVTGLTPDQLCFSVQEGTNTIAWLVWHLTRIQDDHVSDAAGTEQAWIDGGWVNRFALPFDPSATGYGQHPPDVAAVRVDDAGQLTAYHDAVYERTVGYVKGLVDEDLLRIVDESWNPPVTLGARLVSVISDDLQHAGQAAFVRGIVER